MWKAIVRPVLFCATIAASGIAAAGDTPPPPSPEHRHQPPPEAFAACKGLKEGDACSVQFRERTVEGVCAKQPDTELFCRPSHPPPHPER
ncbi:MAG TPA: hypothetical protein VKE22_18300 [Haliangiales bacterium]|nr:hypothetical protein [Haliangiales bacterium]